jgi:transposase-like protein
MDQPSKSRRIETREFWEEAIRLWAESGLPVREFCNREGLTEHTFYSWRREVMPENPASEVNQESSAAEDEAPTDCRRRRGRRPVGATAGKNASAVEFLPVHVIGDDVSRAHAASVETAPATSPIEIVGTSPWHVRVRTGFDPIALEAVLTVLERRPC